MLTHVHTSYTSKFPSINVTTKMWCFAGTGNLLIMFKESKCTVYKNNNKINVPIYLKQKIILKQKRILMGTESQSFRQESNSVI